MELLQLKYFCDAAESENFSKTAKKFSVPASNISQSIRRLEKELSVELFERTPNRIKLSYQGKILYENTKKALLLLNEAKEKISDGVSDFGEIKILAQTNRRIVAQAMEEFREKYDKASFFINHYEDEEISNYDFYITDKILPHKNLERRLFVTDEILLAINKENPLALKKKLSPADLKNEKFITMGKKSSLFYFTNEICSMGEFCPDISIFTDDPDYIRQYVESGAGISFVPAFSWRGIFSSSVVLKKVADRKRYTYIYYDKNKYMTRASKLFLEVLLKKGSG